MTLADLSGDDSLAIAAALATALAVCLVGLATAPASSSRRLKERIARTRTGAGAARAVRDPQASASVRRRDVGTLLGQKGGDLARLLPRSDALRRRLALAGLPLNAADYVALSLLVGLLAMSASHFGAGAPWSIAGGIGLIAASGLPHLLLERRIGRRKRLFLSQFPDAIDLIVRGVRSGLPVAEALQAAGQELPNQVGSLFREVTGNVKLGKTLDESLVMASRTLEVQEFKFFMISLTIQQETGGNLGEILQNLGALMRRREQVKLKIKAMSSEARASAMIIGSLPFIMFGVIYLIDPDYVMKLFTDPRGWMLLAGGLTSLSLGLGIMAKMIRFEI
jgi:tight adherence protein B